ncbi:MAG: sigma-70 family RNA polymerase sigma factor [Gammaproteobacteria bacterium]|nr:sigma-70 family RNA polymerase sigma factor [Gammaproteobacteria bacterium]
MNHKVAVTQAWLEYRKKLLAFIQAKVETTEDAEDILNDVFSTLVKIANENKSPGNLGPWLYHVTKNRIVDYYRSKKTFEQLPEDLTEQHEETNTIKSISKCMLPMIRALPENYQQPLMLSEIEGKKYKEVATELDLTLSAVKSRILRGRKLLHGSILACCEIGLNTTGKIIDFEVKPGNSCDDCED